MEDIIRQEIKARKDQNLQGDEGMPKKAVRVYGKRRRFGRPERSCTYCGGPDCAGCMACTDLIDDRVREDKETIPGGE